MSTPLVWIISPAVASLVLWFFPGLKKARLGLAFIVSLFLAGMALYLPIGTSFSIGPWPIKITDTLSILGRTLTLGIANRPMLVLFFFLASLWFFGGMIVNTNSILAPLGLAIIALLVSALAVVPFLYGALLIEMAVIVSVLILAPPGETPKQGVLRYLIFQTLAVPFILFSGWMLNIIEAGSTDATLIIRVMVTLGFGFAFLLSIFPFNTWLPLLTGQTKPYMAGFVLVFFPMAALLFALNFIDFYSWLRNEPELYVVLKYAGVLMIATGGLGAAFQRHLGRMLGFFTILETGLALLAVGLKDAGGLSIFSALFLPRALGLWLLSISLDILHKRTGSLDFEAVKGKLHEYPFAAACILIAEFSLLGLPLFASFPIQGTLLAALYQVSPVLAVWSFAGVLGLLLASLRSLYALTIYEGPGKWKIGEQGGEVVILSLGGLGLLVLGVLPQIFFPPLLNLLGAYSHLL